MQEETEKSRLDNLGAVGELEAGAVSQEGFRFQGLCLGKANATQQGDIGTLQTELAVMADSNAKRVALQIQVLDLEVGLVHTYGSSVIIYAQCGELGETVFEQRIKISKLERQGLNDPYLYPQPTGIAG